MSIRGSMTDIHLTEILECLSKYFLLSNTLMKQKKSMQCMMYNLSTLNLSQFYFCIIKFNTIAKLFTWFYETKNTPEEDLNKITIHTLPLCLIQ